MDHELAEKLAGLASRVNNLAANHTGTQSRTFMQQQDDLAKLSLAAITADLDSQTAAFKAALQGVKDAIAFIGDADAQLQNVAKAIRLIAKAITLTEKVVGAL